MAPAGPDAPVAIGAPVGESPAHRLFPETAGAVGETVDAPLVLVQIGVAQRTGQRVAAGAGAGGAAPPADIIFSYSASVIFAWVGGVTQTRYSATGISGLSTLVNV